MVKYPSLSPPLLNQNQTREWLPSHKNHLCNHSKSSPESNIYPWVKFSSRTNFEHYPPFISICSFHWAISFEPCADLSYCQNREEGFWWFRLKFNPFFKSIFFRFKIWGYLSNGLGRVWGLVPGSGNSPSKKPSRKRKHSNNRDEENNEEELPLKKSKMLSTSNYIFNNLFENGEDSDIVVHFMNKSWKLHKFYLKQSQYFGK